MKFATYQERQIAYQSEGRGPAVVLLHGFGEDSRVWDEFREDLLEEKYRVVRIDLPGLGASEVLPEMTVEAMAEAVQAVVETLGLDPFVLIGHSMGGYVGLAYAERHPDRLAGLGLFHSHPYADSEAKREDRRKSIEFVERQGHVIYLKQLMPKLFHPQFARSNAFLMDKLIYRATKYPTAGITGALRAMMERPDRSAVLTEITCPVLFIVGREDKVVPADKSLEQTHLPAVASIHLLEKVGHMGMFEARKKTQRIVRQFVEYCYQTHDKS